MALRIFMSLLILIVVILVIFFIVMFLSSFPKPTATVKLVPISRALNDSTVVTVAARQISSTQSGTQMGSSTAQPKQSTRATGVLTFENYTFSWVTIPAGTSVSSTTGEEVVTEMKLNVPPDPGMPGVASVSAHTVSRGRRSNIQAMSVNKACCFAGIFVLNKSAFSGGTDAQVIPTVQQSDIDRIANSLKTSLTQEVLNDMQSHLTSDEQLLSTTLHCSTKAASTPKVGESATYVTVTISLDCSESAYSQQRIQLESENWLKQKAIQQFGTTFVLGAIKTSISEVAEGKNGSVNAQVSVKGICDYQFTTASKLDMIKYIAGKTKRNAEAWLSQQKGVDKASISIKGPYLNWGKNHLLPENIKDITLEV